MTRNRIAKAKKRQDRHFRSIKSVSFDEAPWMVKINKTIGTLLVFLLLFGCQLPKDKMSTAKDIEVALQEASTQNVGSKKQTGLNLPTDVTRALMPSVQTNPTKNMATVEKRFDLVAEQVPARTFFLSLVEDTPYNITVHPGVEGKISLQLKKVTIPEVLETVKNVYGYDFRQTSQGVEVLPATLQTRSFPVNYLDLNRGGTSEIQVAAGTLSGAGSSNSSSSSASSGSSGSTSSTGSSTPAGTNSKITTSSKADFWEELKKAVETIVGAGEGRKVAVSPLASLVVVQAMPDELKRVEEFLKSAELSLNRQVILEAKILEVELDDSAQAGINWGMVNGNVTNSLVGGSTIAKPFNFSDTIPRVASDLASTVGVTPGGRPLNTSSKVSTFGGVFALSMSSRNLSTFIELLGAQGKVHVLSSPRVSTINNQKALIKVGTDKFFVTNVSTTTTASTATTQSTPNVTFDSFFSGVALDVTPHITDTDEITLHIHPTISVVEDDPKSLTIANQTQSFPLAKSTIRESDSVVRAKNGEMVIIGGLMQNQSSDFKQGIPILKDLPLLGNLFRHTVQKTTKSELVILLRPIVVNNGTPSEVIDDTLDRFRKLDEEIQNDEYRYRAKNHSS